MFTYESFSECYLFRFRIGFNSLSSFVVVSIVFCFSSRIQWFSSVFDGRFFEFFIIWITNRTSITIAISLRCNNFVYEIHYLEIKCIWKLYLIDKPASFIGATVVEMVVSRCLALSWVDNWPSEHLIEIIYSMKVNRDALAMRVDLWQNQ